MTQYNENEWITAISKATWQERKKLVTEKHMPCDSIYKKGLQNAKLNNLLAKPPYLYGKS